MATVIVGAGIVAFYLSQPPSATSPSSIHLVESSPELFASASGYAAGFLCSGWLPPPVASLGALSLALHKQLADEHSGYENWGYCGSTYSSLSLPKSGKPGYLGLADTPHAALTTVAHAQRRR